MNAMDALYGFVAWLSCREQAATFSSKHDVAEAVELLVAFARTNKLPEPSPDWPRNVRFPEDD